MKKGKYSHLKEHTYFVKGMHCASCELLIEKKFLKYKNVESVEASASSGQVVIFYRNKKPALNKLNKEFKENGYVFFHKPVIEKEKNFFLLLNKDGQLLINKKRLLRSTQIFGITLFLIIGFLLLSRSEIASKIIVSSASTLPAFFLFGLLAGTSSCAALVGGIVLSMAKQWSEIHQNTDSLWQKFQPHLLFNTGRLISFAILGALLGGLGVFLQISLTTTSLLGIGVSLIMILLASQMLGIKFFQKFQLTAPKFISRFIADETNFRGRHMPLSLGALTFFLPCGFTITVQGLALASGSSLRGSLMMLAFSLGTLPMLVAIGFSSLKLVAKPNLSDKFLKIAGILVLFFGIYNLNSQLNVLGLPSLTDIKLSSSKRILASNDGFAPIINGKQILKMDALAFAYEPDEFKVRTGVPVRWEIRNKGVSGCTNAIVSKGLFKGQIRLDQDINVKEFVPQKMGRYKFSCWMGMVSGVIKVIDQDSAAEEFVDWGDEEVPSGASGCGGDGNDGGCSGGCGGGCGNPGCPYAR